MPPQREPADPPREPSVGPAELREQLLRDIDGLTTRLEEKIHDRSRRLSVDSTDLPFGVQGKAITLPDGVSPLELTVRIYAERNQFSRQELRTLGVDASYVIPGPIAKQLGIARGDQAPWLVRQRDICATAHSFDRGYVLSGPTEQQQDGQWEHHDAQFTDDNTSPEVGLMTLKVILQRALAKLDI